MKPDNSHITIVHNTLQGIERASNQDDILIISRPDFHLFLLFDGVSSLNESIDCIASCKRFILKNHNHYISDDKTDLQDLVYAMHAESIATGEIGKTTCSALLLKKGHKKGYVVSIGDSRVYAFSRSYMEAVTDDDNLSGNSYVLTKYIGWEGLELEDVNQIEVDMNQNFLICSDGFYALMEKDVMAYFRVFHFKRKGNIINAINRLQKNRNKDDSTYIIIRHEGV